MRGVTLVDAPSSGGAYAPGQEDGPRALRAAGLVERLRDAGVDVQEGGACAPFRWVPDKVNRRAANPDVVVDRASAVAARVAAVPRDRLAVVLGGDCTVGVGTVAGLVRRGDDVGLVYLDRHADLNVPTSTDEGALDWMGVAHVLDVDGAVDGLASIAGRRPMLQPSRVSFLGLQEQQSPFQDDWIDRLSLAVVRVERLVEDPVLAARSALDPLRDAETVTVHFDCDVVDFVDAPLAENAAKGLAPSLDATGAALAEVLADARVVALTLTEFNPHHGAADGEDTRRLVDTLVSAITAAR